MDGRWRKTMFLEVGGSHEMGHLTQGYGIRFHPFSCNIMIFFLNQRGWIFPSEASKPIYVWNACVCVRACMHCFWMFWHLFKCAFVLYFLNVLAFVHTCKCFCIFAFCFDFCVFLVTLLAWSLSVGGAMWDATSCTWYYALQHQVPKVFRWFVVGRNETTWFCMNCIFE